MEPPNPPRRHPLIKTIQEIFSANPVPRKHHHPRFRARQIDRSPHVLSLRINPRQPSRHRALIPLRHLRPPNTQQQVNPDLPIPVLCMRINQHPLALRQHLAALRPRAGHLMRADQAHHRRARQTLPERPRDYPQLFHIPKLPARSQHRNQLLVHPLVVRIKLQRHLKGPNHPRPIPRLLMHPRQHKPVRRVPIHRLRPRLRRFNRFIGPIGHHQRIDIQRVIRPVHRASRARFKQRIGKFPPSREHRRASMRNQPRGRLRIE